MVNTIKREQGVVRQAATSSHITKHNESSLGDHFFVIRVHIDHGMHLLHQAD
jgi:hypothetical protein